MLLLIEAPIVSGPQLGMGVGSTAEATAMRFGMQIYPFMPQCTSNGGHNELGLGASFTALRGSVQVTLSFSHSLNRSSKDPDLPKPPN